MDTYCCVSACRRDTGEDRDTRTLYRSPLYDPHLIQQWLTNLGTTSRYQYNAHNYAKSSFEVQQICDLKRDAVPAFFQGREKRKPTEQSERKAKRFRADTSQSITVSDDWTVAAEMEKQMHLREIIMESESEETRYLVLSEDADCDDLVQSVLNQYQGLEDDLNSEESFLLSDFSVIEDTVMFSDNEDSVEEVEVISEDGAGGEQKEEPDVDGDPSETQIILQDEGLTDDDNKTGIIAYFETIPNVFPYESQIVVSPETVVSCSLSSEPITSTLPIVSTHAQSSNTSHVLTEEEDSDSGPDEDGCEHQSEHRYNENSLTKRQLEAIVSELQRNVKDLQQRDRWYRQKVLVLESTLNQLRQSNLLHEETLHVLESTFIQPCEEVPDVAEMVDVYSGEEDHAVYFQTEDT